MPHIEPNYTFGVRIPWTLNDSDNWRRTHRFAGPVFVIMGVVTLVSAFLASAAPELTLIALLVALLGGVGLITLYSFLLWKGVIRQAPPACASPDLCTSAPSLSVDEKNGATCLPVRIRLRIIETSCLLVQKSGLVP